MWHYQDNNWKSLRTTDSPKLNHLPPLISFSKNKIFLRSTCFYIGLKEPDTGETNATVSTRHTLITTLSLTQFQQNWAHWVYWTTPYLGCWSSENAVKAVCIAYDLNLTISDDWQKLIKPLCLHCVTNLARPYVILNIINQGVLSYPLKLLE